MKRLQMQPGAESIGHGGKTYIVNNHTWQVLVDDEVANFMLEDGRSGCALVPDPEPGALVCPCCGYSWRPENEAKE